MSKSESVKVEKTTLNVELITQCGLKLAREEGVDALTIRKIAQWLGVTPMAIYRHFTDKNALLAAVLDAFIIEADVIPEADKLWTDWFYLMGCNMYQALCEMPSWIPYLGRLALQKGALTVLDAYVSKMMDAGFNHEQAMRGFFALLQSVVGAATLTQAFANTRQHMQNSSLDEVNGLQDKTVERSVSRAPHDFFDDGLSLLIDALARELKYKMVWKPKYPSH